MSEFEFRIEGARGPATEDVVSLDDEMEARAEAAELFAQLIRDDAADLWNSPNLKLTVTDRLSDVSFVLELSARTG